MTGRMLTLIKRGMKPSKYRNIKCEWRGEKFDSKRELERWLVLLEDQRLGKVKKLRRQVPMNLIVNGVVVGKYIADFSYVEPPMLTPIYEDCKGMRLPLFNLKWRIVQAMHPTWEFRLS